MMTLGELQRMFPPLAAKLINQIYLAGYQATFGDAFRDPRVHGEYGASVGYGRAWSNHKVKLAIDLNLFKKVNGIWVYCDSTEDHKPFGEYWKTFDPLCEWGGDGDRKDGNHYSLRYQGRW